MIRRWFETLLTEYHCDKQSPVMDCLAFNCGSFHFLHRAHPNIHHSKCEASVYFDDCNLNISSIPNHFNICGAALSFKTQNSFSESIHDVNCKFVNYKGTMLLELLNGR